MDLIEPYWNVKQAFQPGEIRDSNGFNRTILECKERFAIGQLHQPPDLIEPYWNVKKDDNVLGVIKGIDLIEPYWNVKLFKRFVQTCYLAI